MIWNGWVLGLIIGQIAVTVINAVAFSNAFKVIRYWNNSSLAALQLDLENRSELISTVVSWSLLFQTFSLLVFEIAARSLASCIPGAMCTTGTLQAHYLGWPVLFVKIASLYLYGWWVVINHVDMQIEGFPLTRMKSWYMVFLFPLLIADVLLQIGFFTGLDPCVISSCCGVVFEVGGEGFGSSVASLSPQFMRVALAGYLAALVAIPPVLWRKNESGCKIVFALGSAIALIVGAAGLVAFVAPYVYMMPALHCPFIFLDQEHFNYGYLAYIPLFAASFFGTAVGILALIEWRFPEVLSISQEVGVRFIRNSQMLWILFLAVAYGPAIKFWIEAGGRADLFQVGH